MSKIFTAYRSALERHRTTLDQHQIESWVGTILGSDALKLFRPHWHNAADHGSAGEGKIFFSVWVDHRKPPGRANYNIHALKLRLLKSYALQSREFADAFRQEFRHQIHQWPNVSMDYGPQTLMQGWIELDFAKFDSELDRLILRFVSLHGILDRLLQERKKLKSAAAPSEK